MNLIVVVVGGLITIVMPVLLHTALSRLVDLIKLYIVDAIRETATVKVLKT